MTGTMTGVAGGNTVEADLDAQDVCETNSTEDRRKERGSNAVWRIDNQYGISGRG